MKYPIVLDDEILLSNDDVLRYIREKLGNEIYGIVLNWHDEANTNYEQYKEEIDSDLDSYESQIEEMQNAINDVRKVADKLILYVNNEKRMKRSKLSEYGTNIILRIEDFNV